MTESVRPRLAEQPIDHASSAEGPAAGATILRMSLFPASGYCGCSTGGVDQRPSTPTRQSHPEVKRVAHVMKEVVSKRRSAIETTDALPKNFPFGGNGLLFSIDRLFHRRRQASAAPGSQGAGTTTTSRLESGALPSHWWERSASIQSHRGFPRCRAPARCRDIQEPRGLH